MRMTLVAEQLSSHGVTVGPQDVMALPDQLRAVDRRRLVRKLGDLNSQTLAKIDHTLRIVLNLLSWSVGWAKE